MKPWEIMFLKKIDQKHTEIARIIGEIDIFNKIQKKTNCKDVGKCPSAYIRKIAKQIQKKKEKKNYTHLIKCSNAHYRAVAHIYAKSLGLFSYRSKPSKNVDAACINCGHLIGTQNTGGSCYYHDYLYNRVNGNSDCIKCQGQGIGDDCEYFTHKFYTLIDGVVVSKTEKEIAHLKTKRHEKILINNQKIHKSNWENLIDMEQEIKAQIPLSKDVTNVIVKMMDIPTEKKHVPSRADFMPCN